MTGASSKLDRAVVNGAGQAVSALRASVPSAAHCPTYLMRGKRYTTIPDGSDGGRGFWITTERGDQAYCRWNDCAHLNGGSWQRHDPAQAIEARRAETGTGSVADESAVRKDAPNSTHTTTGG